MKTVWLLALVLCVQLFQGSYALAAAPSSSSAIPIIDHTSIFHPVLAEQGMVSSQEAIATQVGLDVLRDGGNAVDAAVAVGFALAVTLPKAGNLGGGGFMMIHLAETGETLALDYREMAPALASEAMFLNEQGDVDKHLSRNSFQSAGVPGTVRGLTQALRDYGSQPLAKLLQPAIELAEKGFVISHDLASELKSRRSQLSRSEAGKKIFYHSDGRAFEAGERLIQKDLAWSLRQIAKHGEQAFYEGAIAKKIAQDSKRHQGLIDMRDLANYEAVMREAVKGDYRGYGVYSMPPPSSGGVHVLQMLQVLKNFDLNALGHNSADYLHVLSETMKYAYADRSKYLGDPDFATVPVAELTAPAYGLRIAKKIDMNKARPSDDIKPGSAQPFESHDTTHFSVADSQGNVVSNTYTLNFSYGSGIVIEGTGILLNNEMDDFSSKPGVPNAFGLLGGEANAIEPRKRPLSAMTPLIVLKDDKPYLVVGSPGGSKIINVVLQVVLNVLDHGMNIAEASSVPRIHHQWYPDVLNVERGISLDTLRLLRAKGYETKETRVLGSTQSILLQQGRLEGASDPRRPGALTLGY